MTAETRLIDDDPRREENDCWPPIHWDDNELLSLAKLAHAAMDFLWKMEKKKKRVKWVLRRFQYFKWVLCLILL